MKRNDETTAHAIVGLMLSGLCEDVTELAPEIQHASLIYVAACLNRVKNLNAEAVRMAVDRLQELTHKETDLVAELVFKEQKVN